MQSQRIDPLVLSAWTHDIATWLPSLTRQEHSRYVQAAVAHPSALAEGCILSSKIPHFGQIKFPTLPGEFYCHFCRILDRCRALWPPTYPVDCANG